MLVAMTRVGLLPLQRNEKGGYYPPSLIVAADPEGTRAARRKYRKLWRRALARDLKEFDRMPRRRQKQSTWQGGYIKGKWQSREDPLEGRLLQILSYDVGRRPRRNARGMRWDLVKACPELRKELLKVANEFGLLDPQRSM